MTTQQKYTINGVLDTNRTNMENLQILANNCGCWISHDENSGKWGVVINQAGTSAYSFGDDEIIGGIDLASAPLDRVYNTVEVTYPNKDIEGGTDNITLALPSGEWHANEVTSKKEMNYSLCDNAIQAQYLAYLNLNQSRRDEVVRLLVTFGNLDIKAGDIFDITNTARSWTNREFRAIKVVEKENNGDIFLEITGVDYSADTYDITEIVNYDRTFNDGIISIGAIGQAGTPQVTKFEQNARPRVLIESTVPETTTPADNTTVVTDMEFWIYVIPESELPNWNLVDDDTRSYTLLASQTSPEGTFEPGDTALLDTDSLNSSNFLIKTRARNDKVTGPFSDNSGLVTFTPEQTTQAIPPDAKWYDEVGALVAGMVLMKLLEDLFTGNVTGPGSLYDKIFSLFRDDPESGNFLSGSAAVLSIYATTILVTTTAPYDDTTLVDSVVFPYDGLYEVFVYADSAASSETADGWRDMSAKISGVLVASSSLADTEGSFNDLSIMGFASVPAGTYDVTLDIRNENTNTPSFDIQVIIHYLGEAVE